MKKLLEEATADDIYLEYLWFLRNAPKLLNNQMPDLLFLVKRELGVGRIEEKLTGKLNYNYNSRCTVFQNWHQSVNNDCTTNNQMSPLLQRFDTKQ